MPEHSLDNIIDFAIMQKFLPKLHGSATSLRPVLIKLGQYCLKVDNEKSDNKPDKLPDYVFPDDNDKLRYSVSYQKIYRMEKKIESDGFASYPEA
jgi:5-methylcytosine-specific restriction protein B